MTELRDLCFRRKLRIQGASQLDRLTRRAHLGVVAQVANRYVSIEDILERVPEDETPLIGV